MIQLTGAGKRYGPKILFENVDWMVTPTERVGIVGANGTGKSSLLKVFAGMEGLDSGTISTQKGVTLGYLPQHPEFDPERTLRRSRRFDTNW